MIANQRLHKLVSLIYLIYKKLLNFLETFFVRISKSSEWFKHYFYKCWKYCLGFCFWVLSGESWPLRHQLHVSSPRSDPIFSRVIAGHHPAVPEPGQEDPFLLESFFPSASPTPAHTHPLSFIVSRHFLPTCFPSLRFPGYSYRLIAPLGPQTCSLPTHRTSRDGQHFLDYSSGHLQHLQLKSPWWPRAHPEGPHGSGASPALLQRQLGFPPLVCHSPPCQRYAFPGETSCSLFRPLYFAQRLAREMCSVNVEQTHELLTN